MMSIDAGEEYDFPNFVHTIAHEIAHCILIDYDPKYFSIDTDPHGERHRTLTEQLKIYLWTLSEIKELEKLQTEPR